MKLFGKKDKKEKKNNDNKPGEDKNFFKRLQTGLSKTRNSIAGRLDRIFLGKKEITEDLLEELEEILFTSDLGVATTQELIESVQEKVKRRELKDPETLKNSLKDQMISFLEAKEIERPLPAEGAPYVIMVIGVNGVGKTTSIGKLANHFISEKKKVMLVAGDTFRAAAVEQLSIWAERVGADIVKQDTGADPSAVVYDSLSAAISRKSDVVIIDTAGRLHTKANLMEELKKINRVAGNKLPGAPHDTWLVLDATTGQNAISQAETFNNAIGVTGIILTKLDGTAKGGIVVGISNQLNLPIKYIGIGEQVDDLRPFDAPDFVKAIFD